MQKASAERIAPTLLGVLLLIPAALFYWIVSRNAVAIPILDDYDIILSYANWMSGHHALSSRLLYILTNEHNGYKLMFENAVVFVQYSLLGSIHLLALVILGNAFALAIFLAVAFMFREGYRDTGEKWVLLIPAGLLIFQLQYASALDFASSSLQHLAVVCFSMLAILLLDRKSSAAFRVSSVALIFAIASSPNGFFAGAAGLLLTGQKRQWRRLGGWAAVLVGMLILYLFRYSSTPAQATPGMANERPGMPNPIYALSFLGASGATYSSVVPSVLLGAVLCGVILLAVQKGYFRKNPAIFYSMIFIIMNAVAVSGLRSDMGVAQSLASRYRTYSNLLLAFSYLFMIEDLLPRVQTRSLRAGAFWTATILSVAFCGASDFVGARFLAGKKQALQFSYRTQWLGEAADQAGARAGLNANPALQRQIEAGVTM